MSKKSDRTVEPHAPKGQLILPILAALAGVGLFFLPMADLIHAYDPEARVRFWTLDYMTFLAVVFAMPLLVMRSKGLALRVIVIGVSLVYIVFNQLEEPHWPGVSEIALAVIGVAIIVVPTHTRTIRALVLLYCVAYFGFLQGACPRLPGALELILLHLSDDHQIVMHVIKVGSILALGVLFGRYYCGWICPKGVLQEYIYRPRIGLDVPRGLDRVLKLGKFVMLAVLVLSPLLFAVQVFRHIGPFRVLFNLDGELYVIVFLGVVLVSSMFIERAYCRYFCPEGALLALAQLVGAHRVRLDRDACTQCGRCMKVCPVDAIPSESKNAPLGVSRVECITCLECRAACRDDAIYYGLRRRASARAVAAPAKERGNEEGSEP